MKAEMLQKLFFALALCLLMGSGVISLAQAADSHVLFKLYPATGDLKAGQTVTVGLELTPAPGWHTYWLNPGDSGTAAKVEWHGVAGLEAGKLQWPTPEKILAGPLVNYGYARRTVLLQDLTLPKDYDGKPATLTADLSVLVCQDICIPEKHQARFSIGAGAPGFAGEVEKAKLALPLDMGWAASLYETPGNLIVKLQTDAAASLGRPGTIELFPEEWGLIDNAAKPSVTRKGDVITITQKRGERALAEAPVSKLVISYKDPHGERRSVRVSAISDTPGKTPDKNSDKTETGTVGFGHAILLALLGGLILNLMPCVFPVLSMKALSLVALKDKELNLARRHGLAYTAGVVLCFVVIAAALLALKAGGAQVGWGFQLQHPAIILFLAYLFFALGLNLAGYFDIDLGLSNAGQTLTRRDGVSGSFFTGALATLVATPCTAPFMGVAMGYALTQGAPAALSVFVALGFGLALPYLALCFVPTLRHWLPRPGAWMETLRQFLSFPMFAASCWLVWVLSQQVDYMGQFAALLGMVALAFGIWLLKTTPRRNPARTLTVLLAILSFGFTMSTFISMKPVSPAEQQAAPAADNWRPFTSAALEDALKGDRPVFVNMTAAWCITCKVNEKVALSRPEAKALFADRNVTYLKGDWTNQNPEITVFLERYGRSGVPLYVYYPPRDDKSGARPEPKILPQILTVGALETALNP